MQLQTLDQEFIDEIMDRFGNGCSTKMMCHTMSISRSTFYKWMDKGCEEDNEPFTSFRKRVENAKASYLWACVKDIKAAGRKAWQANAWLLERKDPESFSPLFACKKYPEELKDLPRDLQGDCIYGMMLSGRISQHEAHNFVEILAKIAQIDENVRLREELFEIQEKLGAK